MMFMRYLVFFFEPDQSRENQLCAIQPLFNNPSAVKVLLKTARFEDKAALVYVGTEESLEILLKKTARLDLTDWLDFDFSQIKKALDFLAEELEISVFTDQDEEIVVGDPPVVNIEAAAKNISYPPDIPEKNHWLWDDVKKNYRREINTRAGKDKDKKEAIQRILYFNSALKLNLIPFSFNTATQINDARDVLAQDIEQGEEQASQIINTWERHLKSDGTLKKTKAIRYLGSDHEEKSSRYYIAHAVEWTLDAEWKTLCDYLNKNHGFHVLSKDHLTMTINRLTKLEVIQEDGNKVAIYISHVFTPSQAATLTSKVRKDDIVKMLHKYTTLWYKTGKFPDIKKI